MSNLPYISPDLLRQYQKEVTFQTSPATARRKMSALKRFFGWAHQEGHIQENPIQEMLPPLTPGAQIITTRAPRFKLSNVFKLGIPLVLVILVFLLVRDVKLPIPFLPAPAKETEVVTTTPIPTPLAEIPIDKTLIIAELKEEVLKLIGSTLEWASFEDGNLLIGGAQVSSLTLSTGDTTDGDITINPDGSGIAHFLFEGTGENFLNAQAPNLISGSLYYGVVANGATGYDLIRLQSGSNPVTRFSVDALGNTDIGGSLNVEGDISTDDTVRLTSAGALTNITGYSQTSGNFSISQGAGDSGTITKKASALADLLTLTLDERGQANSIYSTLTLKRFDGSTEGMALFVDEGNARFDGQIQLGRFSSTPDAIGEGSIIYNTADTNLYYYNGTSWNSLGTATSISFADITTGTNTQAAMVVGNDASLTYSGTGTITASDLTCTDCLDFTELADAMTLDASTNIALGANTLSTSGTGALNFASTGQVTFAGNVNATAGVDVTGANLTVGSSGEFSVDVSTGNVTTAGDLAVNGGDLTSTASTFNFVNSGVSILNIGGAASTVSLGASTGTTTINNDLAVSGGDITGASGAALDLGEANAGDITATGDFLPAADNTYDLGSSGLRWQDFYVVNLNASTTTIAGTTSETFTIDTDDTGGDLAYIFGTTLNERLIWDSTDLRFEFSDDLQVQGGVDITGGLGC
ncbi:MAG: Virion structural protein [Candidatus Woesebacteria bacterium GW2011_GWE1_45_18]|uniref:Virion structural protein n=1 Tax=Candidatus Woesebacteria bacterium GW2011_GWE1_45_18 TaxID=1618598 RepID=A0A0G1P7S9_9BACT|nr:MAG: Virion structural protein [Candidatus Woesebacteria bacterium GW2011_GWE1_45_18]